MREEERVEVAVAGRVLTLSHLDKPLWPADGLTKAHYLDYLRAVAPHLLPHLRDRPLSVTRWPDGIGGEGFFQKDCPAPCPPWVATFTYRTRESGREIRFVLCQDLPTLLWLGNLACLEFHPWLSTAAHPDRPDLAVVDLDPAPPAGLAEARAAALLVREALAALGLTGFPKLSGATGVHVYLPLEPRHPFRTVAAFGRALGQTLLRRHPRLFTLERTVARRAGRVYLDYLQNGLGKTMVAPYSPRPLPGAPVSCPVTWEELATAAPAAYTVRTVPGLLARRGDPWAALPALRQRLPAAGG